jgi:hypothetical protein
VSTAGYVKLLLPPRQSRGTSHWGLAAPLGNLRARELLWLSLNPSIRHPAARLSSMTPSSPTATRRTSRSRPRCNRSCRSSVRRGTDTSLSATPHLWPSIEQALGQSRFLILLASPEAAASRWVGQEVAYWLDHNSADTVLIALTEGELDWDQATSDFRWSLTPPLPAALKNRFASEPRWIDLRPYRGGSIPTGTEFMGLGADFAGAIHGIPKEDLLSEEVRQQRRARTLAGTAATLLVALLVAAGWQWRVAETQRGIAEAQTKVAEAQTKEAQTQRNEAQLQRDKARAQLLAMQARRAYTGAKSTDDIERAGALALESIEIARNSNRPPEGEAIEAAKSALVGLSFPVLSQGSEVVSLAVLADGRLASGDGNGKIKIWPKEGRGEPVVLAQGSRVEALAVLADGRLASGGSDLSGKGNIKIWPKERTGEPVVLAQSSWVLSLAVLADGRLASGGADRSVKSGPRRVPVSRLFCRTAAPSPPWRCCRTGGWPAAMSTARSSSGLSMNKS